MISNHQLQQQDQLHRHNQQQLHQHHYNQHLQQHTQLHQQHPDVNRNTLQQHTGGDLTGNSGSSAGSSGMVGKLAASTTQAPTYAGL